MKDKIIDLISELRKHEENYQQVYGVKFMIEGLCYHYENFIEVVDRSNDSTWFHEVIAYLNRLGQVYYFLKSDFIKAKSTDIKEIKRCIRFRMKNSAHRHVDMPKDNDSLIMMDITLPTIIPVKPRLPEYTFPYKHGETTKGISLPKINKYNKRTADDTFFLEESHNIIMDEIFNVIKRKLSKLSP